MSAQFEADLCPQTGAPRIRLNFGNGWSASIVLHLGAPNGCDFKLASMAVCPTGRWGEGLTELLGEELFADEVALGLAELRKRGRPA